MTRRILLILILFSSSVIRHSSFGAGASPTVSIAAASDLVYCLEALHAAFLQIENPPSKTENLTALTVTTGSSGNFFAQIKHGAPYDIFLSADLSYPRALITARLADPASLTSYAIGRLVLWTAHRELDIAAPASVVRDARVKKFAIANPAHAPYGRAAQQTLEKLGVWSTAQPKLVLGENISQTAQFVQTGNADAGLVALSLVLAPPLRDVGRWHEIPAGLHEPLEQAAVLTLRGAANPAAVRYLAFLRSPAAREIFDRFGFRLPSADAR